MSIFRNLFARSEQWRLEWGCRNCVSVAFVTFLYLYGPTKHYLTRYGPASTSYATVVTTFVKDVTIGATLTNAWTCLLGVFNATIFSWIYFLIVRRYYVDSVPLLVTLVTICVSTFVLQYVEMVPMTKKFSVGVIPIYLINNRNEPNPSFFIWGMFFGSVIGCGCAFIGCILPFPIRLASTELRERIEYYSVSMSSLLKDLTQSWLGTYKSHNKRHHRQSERHHYTMKPNESGCDVTKGNRDSSEDVATPTVTRIERQNQSSSPPHQETPSNSISPVINPCASTEHSYWRKLRLILSTIGAFKYRQHLKRSTNLRRKYSTRFLRTELVNYLQETLPYLQSRNLETGFGFTRRVGNRCAKFVKLIQDILLIITKFEGHIESMENSPKFHYLYEAFFSRPNLHYGFAVYVQSIVDVIMSISVVLVEQSVFDDQLLTPGNEGFKAVAAAAKLIRARKYFDAEYLKARRDLFYPQFNPENAAEQLDIRKDGSELLPPVSPVHSKATTISSDGSKSILRSLSPPFPLAAPASEGLLQQGKLHQKKKKGALRADTKAMLDVNSSIFLLDTLSRLLLEFWSADDLVQMSVHEALKPIPGSLKVPDEPLIEEGEVDNIHSIETPFWKSARKFVHGTRRFLWELFPPSQAHLIPQRHPDRSKPRWVLTDTIKQRLAMAAKVSAAMTIGAFYGIIANRPAPHLASMTVAFIAGGTVSGISVMTCINRAAGTAVACVYSIMVAYIVNYWDKDWERDLFVGFAVVLLQLPATYVRSYPLYSYSGVVTAFTCVLILLARNISTEFAVNRIIDSYVGVALFLFIELAFAARFTEDELLGDMARVFSGLHDRFGNMHRNFQFFKAAEDSMAEVRSRIRGGTLDPSGVEEELKRVESLREDIKNRKALEVESMQALIRRQLQLGPFYRSEPAIWRPLVFPTSILEESVALQKQAVNSIQIMIWAVMTCDGTFDGRVERMVGKLDRKIKRNAFDREAWSQRISAKDDGVEMRSSLESLVSSKSRSSSPGGSQNGSSSVSPILILPEFQSLLLPLEPHFIEVERFVSAVLTFLGTTMEQISDWKPALKHFRDPIEIPCLTQPVPSEYSRRHRPVSERSVEHASSTLAQLHIVGEARYTKKLDHLSDDSQRDAHDRLSYGKDDVFHSTELGSLHGKYKRLVYSLQHGLVKEGSHCPNTSRIVSNREVVIVNTLITSTQLLMEALHGLTNVVSRMQAHRDIHVTQDGKRL